LYLSTKIKTKQNENENIRWGRYHYFKKTTICKKNKRRWGTISKMKEREEYLYFYPLTLMFKPRELEDRDQPRPAHPAP
jgi:hypothetical protein